MGGRVLFVGVQILLYISLGCCIEIKFEVPDVLKELERADELAFYHLFYRLERLCTITDEMDKGTQIHIEGINSILGLAIGCEYKFEDFYISNRFLQCAEGLVSNYAPEKSSNLSGLKKLLPLFQLSGSRRISAVSELILCSDSIVRDRCVLHGLNCTITVPE